MPGADLERARDQLGRARRVVVLTGAGISAESGVPTFRGTGGLWKSFRPEQLATPEAFARDPCLVWEWYAWRRRLVAGCEPNPGHHAIARLALRGTPGVTVVTQNVDGLHHRAAVAAAPAPGGRPTGGGSAAGASPRDGDIGEPTMSPSVGSAPALPLELHGALHRDRCSGCAVRTPGSHDVDASDRSTLPRCAGCGALLRPDVVWFGEALDPGTLDRAFEAAGAADLCLVVGTSALVHPAASLPAATLQGGGLIVEVNVEPTPLTPMAAVSLRGAAGEILPALID